MKTKLTFMLMAFAIMLGLQSCEGDHKRTVNSNDFDFKAVNLTVNNGKLTADGNISVTSTVNWTVSVTINGQTTTVGGSNKSDELPVMVGNEIEIQFTPSCQEQTEAYFTMPDGTVYKATVNAPTFKWIVPDNFTNGMQIKGETHYETNDCIYNRTGTITLLALE